MRVGYLDFAFVNNTSQEGGEEGEYKVKEAVHRGARRAGGRCVLQFSIFINCKEPSGSTSATDACELRLEAASLILPMAPWGGGRGPLLVAAVLVLLSAQCVVSKDYVVLPTSKKWGSVPNAIGIGESVGLGGCGTLLQAMRTICAHWDASA